MSKKLVRKLLEQIGEFGRDEGIHDPKLSLKKRKRKEEAEEPEVIDPLQLQVQSMLKLDRAISKLDATGSQSLQRATKKQRRERRKARNAADGGVGNSRSSSSRRAQFLHEPTFDKKKHKAEKKQEQLHEIARLLKKQSRKRA